MRREDVNNTTAQGERDRSSSSRRLGIEDTEVSDRTTFPLAQFMHPSELYKPGILKFNLPDANKQNLKLRVGLGSGGIRDRGARWLLAPAPAIRNACYSFDILAKREICPLHEIFRDPPRDGGSACADAGAALEFLAFVRPEPVALKPQGTTHRVGLHGGTRSHAACPSERFIARRGTLRGGERK